MQTKSLADTQIIYGFPVKGANKAKFPLGFTISFNLELVNVILLKSPFNTQV